MNGKISNETKSIHRVVFKRTMLLLLSVLLLLGLSACGNLLKTLDTAAETMPTPVPLVITPEPVITYTDAMTMPLPDGTEVPAGYTRVETQDAAIALFSFTDTSGAIQYRVFGGYNKLANGVQSEQLTGFYPSDSTGALLADSKEFVDPAAEPFGTGLAQPLPETVRLRAAYQMSADNVITDGAGAYFIYTKIGEAEGAFYASDSTGVMTKPGRTAPLAEPGVPAAR